MSALTTRPAPATSAPTHAPPGLDALAPPFLREVPALLEYRSEADPDAEFIPKTVAGFAFGALAMGLSLDWGETILSQHGPLADMLPGLITRFAFMVGITGVSTSLLLVGLKVRADHSAVELYARHWMNSITTGAAYALLVWGPWFLMNHSFQINRFLAAAVWMMLTTFPAIAARWTIAPLPARTNPSSS